MASVNKVILIGRLGRDPEVKTGKNMAIANLAIATTRKIKEQETTEWHNVVTFGRTAEICQQYLRKGSSVYIEGRLRTRQWERDGQKHYTTEIVCEMMQILSSGQSKPPKPPKPQKTRAQHAREQMQRMRKLAQEGSSEAIEWLQRKRERNREYSRRYMTKRRAEKRNEVLRS